MKVLVNGLQLSYKKSGVQYYTNYLYNELAKIIDENLDLQIVQSESNSLPFSLFRSTTFSIQLSFPRNKRLARILHENVFISSYLRKNNFKIYHSPNYVLPYFISTPSVLTIHDLITLDFPELCQTESVIYFRLLLSRSIKKATKIIAVSQIVKEDIIRHFNVPHEKIAVVYHGISPIFKKCTNSIVLSQVTEKYHLPDKYILFVGNIEPKKNLVRLIKAFYLLKKEGNISHKLVICGKKGWKYKSVFETISALKISNEIIFTDYVQEEDLPVIYSMASLFVFPSLYEGFGFPPLEAMACEVPVMVSNKSSLPEITGGICLQIDPYNIEEIKDGMHKLLTNENYRIKSIKEGKEWVKKFTWEKAAEETLNVYKQALSQ